MKIAEIIFALLVAFIHFYFLYLEMVLWTKPKGLKAFGLKKDFAEKTKVMAANQGLYNGFLASGIVWSILSENDTATQFFLLCVVTAGIYGSISLKQRKILYIQAIPAIIAFILTLI
jgi:putative membrane protein